MDRVTNAANLVSGECCMDRRPPAGRRLPRGGRHTLAALAVILAAQGWAGPSHALSIVFNDLGGVGVGTAAYDGFRAAAALWESALSDDVTVNINVGFTTLSSSVLGQTATAKNSYSYSSVRSALLADATSAADASAVAHLQPGSSVAMVTTNGSGARFFDDNGSANNTKVSMTTANARALGLISDNGTDAQIVFNSSFGFDFDKSNGITGFDFVGIAAHEIGHALGFVSGVDVIDVWSRFGISADSTSHLTTLDLFRFSLDSLLHGDGVVDSAVGGTPYLSADGGETVLDYMSTGKYGGDGRQASHWKSGLGNLMDPTVSYGYSLDLEPNDLTAFDLIGWDYAAVSADPPSGGSGGTSGGSGGSSTASSVPAPGGLTLLIVGLVATAGLRSRLRIG